MPKPKTFLGDLRSFAYSIRWPLAILLLLWVVHAADVVFKLDLYRFGIFPRSFQEISGIFLAPLIHGSWGHLASNSLPYLALTSMLVLFYPRVALQVSLLLWVGTGFFVWLLARPSYHIGISGVVYGYISFIFWTGIFRKNHRATVLSLIVLTLYAGSVESIFPNVEKGISWESHLFGGTLGLILAFIYKNVLEGEEMQATPGQAVSEHDNSVRYFLPRDAFEKTRLQRYYEQLEEEIRKSSMGEH
jgi:membrane associated rhomboid family serine protease